MKNSTGFYRGIFRKGRTDQNGGLSDKTPGQVAVVEPPRGVLTVADLTPPAAAPVNPQQAFYPHGFKHAALPDIERHMWDAFHFDVNAESLAHPVNIAWLPQYWYFVGRLTAGYITAQIGAGAAAKVIRVDKGTIIVKSRMDVVTAVTVGATGWFSVYPVSDLDALDILA